MFARLTNRTNNKMSNKTIGKDIETYETCEKLAITFIKTNRLHAESCRENGNEEYAKIYDAKAETAQQIVEMIGRYKDAAESE